MFCRHESVVEVRVCDWVFPDGELVAKLCANPDCYARLPADFVPPEPGQLVHDGVITYWAQSAKLDQDTLHKLRERFYEALEKDSVMILPEGFSYEEETARVRAEVELTVQGMRESWRRQDEQTIRQPDGQKCYCGNPTSRTPHWHGHMPPDAYWDR